MNTGHFFRSALNERSSKDGYFGPLAEATPPPTNTQQQPPQQGQAPAQTPAAPTPPQNPQQAPQQAAGAPAQAPAQGSAAPAPQPPQQAAQAASQKTVNQMSVTSQKPVQVAPGISLPAGTPAVITPVDLNGNVNVQIGDKTHKVPDANMKQLIKSGELQVAQAESYAGRLAKQLTRAGF